jgi:hypothetical protein
MLRKLATIAALVLAGVIVIALAGVAVARALLPDTACSVTDTQYRALSMEISYDKARTVLGCEGVLISRSDLGDLVIETYAWRGAAWPYGRVETVFMNRTLQKSSLLWLDLKLSRP